MTTYSELVTQIRDYTETDSNVFTTVIVNDFIEHAELRIFRDVDLDVFRKYQTASLTSGDAFVGMPGATPNSFSFIRSVNIFSPSGSLGGLADNERKYLEKKEQVLFFVNRRGYAPFMICKNCGTKLSCPNCSIFLTFHKHLNKAMCHHCGYKTNVKQTCKKTNLNCLGFIFFSVLVLKVLW